MAKPNHAPALATMCTCGHDYGTHDASRKGAPCSALGIGPNSYVRSKRCKCKRFEAKSADLLASAKHVMGIARELAGSDGPRTKGDSLLLCRIAVALERIAEASEGQFTLARAIEDEKDAEKERGRR